MHALCVLTLEDKQCALMNWGKFKSQGYNVGMMVKLINYNQIIILLSYNVCNLIMIFFLL